jgi:hypothetical protein
MPITVLALLIGCGTTLAPSSDRSVFKGDGELLTLEWTDSGVVPNFGAQLSSGDANGDGHLDLLAGSVSKAVWLPGSPSGVTIAEWVAPGGTAFFVGDLDGDGYDEVAANDLTASTLAVYRGGPSGPGYPATWTYADRLGVGVGDLDADGFDDLLLYRSETEDAVVHLGGTEGPEALPAWQRAVVWPTGGPPGWRAGDVDGDGFDDFSLATMEGSALFLGSATGPVASTVHGGEVELLYAVGDLNGDGFDELATYHADGVWLSYGSGAGAGKPQLLEVGHSAWVAAAGDVDGDAFDDLLVGFPEEGRGKARVFLGGPDGPDPVAIWTGHRTGLESSRFGSMVAGLGDLDSDGYADIAVSAMYGAGDGQICVYHGGSGASASGACPSDDEGDTGDKPSNEMNAIGNVSLTGPLGNRSGCNTAATGATGAAWLAMLWVVGRRRRAVLAAAAIGTSACTIPYECGTSDPSTSAYTEIAVRGMAACAIDTNDAVTCWLDEFDQRRVPATHAATGVPLGEFHGLDCVGSGLFDRDCCAIDSTGHALCWSDGFVGTRYRGPFAQVEASMVHRCGLQPDGRLICTGSADPTGLPPPNTRLQRISLSHWGVLCGVTTEGFAECWGRGAAWPITTEPVLDIQASEDRACALLSSGAIDCAGPGGQRTLPGPFTQITLSPGPYDSAVCGLRPDGTAECDGITAPEGTWTQLALNDSGEADQQYNLCGIRSDGHVVCRGTLGCTTGP